jgi:uncharacterized membrane protein YfhO
LLLLSLSNISGISFFNKDEVTYWKSASVLFAPIEYRPIWLHKYRANLPPSENIIVVKGNGSADITEWKAHRRKILAEGKTDMTLKLSTFYFPGWTADIDGNNYNIEIEKGTGAMLIEVPEGRHEIRLIFKDTQIRRVGKTISMITLFSMIIFFTYDLFNRSKHKEAAIQLEKP